MKLLVDMNLVQRLAEMLCEAGHEAVHWSEVGHGADSDHKLVAWALRNQAVILTHDSISVPFWRQVVPMARVLCKSGSTRATQESWLTCSSAFSVTPSRNWNKAQLSP